MTAALTPNSSETDEPRALLVARALRMECFTVAWNVVEGGLAVFAALTAGSVALLAFGADSAVECASGAILVWRLLAERRARDAAAIERLDVRAHKLVAVSLFVLAAYVAVEAARTLWLRETPESSCLGIAVTSVAIVVMVLLARAKRRLAARLNSRALEADAFQTTACWWLSVIALAGIGLNAAFGWWWADPVAALGMTPLFVREGRDAWRVKRCCC